ncbi:phosphoprotein P [Cedar virus]|uniref:Phosphoprotein n=1 Tax=Cedar virus TaxID=1221391 RepID=J7GXK5_9MONO|nr:phosphoprotein P [Cedar virus]AFP87275.1 phosphoprotein P [Cedar virus]AJP33316.1 phosphoprotein P [Cedar virus]
MDKLQLIEDGLSTINFIQENKEKLQHSYGRSSIREPPTSVRVEEWEKFIRKIASGPEQVQGGGSETEITGDNGDRGNFTNPDQGGGVTGQFEERYQKWGSQDSELQLDPMVVHDFFYDERRENPDNGKYDRSSKKRDNIREGTRQDKYNNQSTDELLSCLQPSSKNDVIKNESTSVSNLHVTGNKLNPDAKPFEPTSQSKEHPTTTQHNKNDHQTDDDYKNRRSSENNVISDHATTMEDNNNFIPATKRKNALSEPIYVQVLPSNTEGFSGKDYPLLKDNSVKKRAEPVILETANHPAGSADQDTNQIEENMQFNLPKLLTEDTDDEPEDNNDSMPLEEDIREIGSMLKDGTKDIKTRMNEIDDAIKKINKKSKNRSLDLESDGKDQGRRDPSVDLGIKKRKEGLKAAMQKTKEQLSIKVEREIGLNDRICQNSKMSTEKKLIYAGMEMEYGQTSTGSGGPQGSKDGTSDDVQVDEDYDEGEDYEAMPSDRFYTTLSGEQKDRFDLDANQMSQYDLEAQVDELTRMNLILYSRLETTNKLLIDILDLAKEMPKLVRKVDNLERQMGNLNMLTSTLEGHLSSVMIMIPGKDKSEKEIPKNPDLRPILGRSNTSLTDVIDLDHYPDKGSKGIKPSGSGDRQYIGSLESKFSINDEYNFAPYPIRDELLLPGLRDDKTNASSFIPDDTDRSPMVLKIIIRQNIHDEEVKDELLSILEQHNTVEELNEIWNTVNDYLDGNI